MLVNFRKNYRNIGILKTCKTISCSYIVGISNALNISECLRISQFQQCPPTPPPPLPGHPRGICSRCQSQGGAFAILLRPGAGHLTRVFKSAMDEFLGKDEAFVEQWLLRQGVDKLVYVFKGMFSQFLIILHYL